MATSRPLSILLFGLVLVGPAAAQLVPRGAVWRYLDDGSDPGPAWTAPAFDDSAWSVGPAELGYGEGDEATVVSFGPNPSDKHPATYFRHRFTVAQPGRIARLSLELLRDDGAVVYLNGTEVARSNLVPGPLPADGLALRDVDGAEEGHAFPFEIDPRLLVAGDNLLAVELRQASPASDDLSFDLELTGHELLVRAPYLQRSTTDGVVIRWRTAFPVETELRWGTSPAQLDRRWRSAERVEEHEVVLRGLPAGQEFFYAVAHPGGVLAGGDAAHSFRTLPARAAAGPLRVWVLGDSGAVNVASDAVRGSHHAFRGGAAPDLWLMLGDNAYGEGTEVQNQKYLFAPFADTLRRSPLFATRGNHDRDAVVHYRQFTLPAAGECGGVPSGSEAYYSIDLGGVHFVCLDSTGSDRSPAGPMMSWLAQDLAANDRDWLVAFFHHPPYTKGSHDSDVWSDSDGRMFDMREVAAPLLEAAGADLVLSGHSHGYERSYLIEGHTGLSSSFDPGTMVVDGGDGSTAGDGPYVKVRGAERGTVYVVAGSSARVGGGSYAHPAMLRGLAEPGSLLLDVDGDRLDVRFLRADGVVRDEFTLLARDPQPGLAVTGLVAGGSATATLSGAASGDMAWFGWSLAGPGPSATAYGDVALSPPVRWSGPVAVGANGSAAVGAPVPVQAAGWPVWLQAIATQGPTQGQLSPPLALVVG